MMGLPSRAEPRKKFDDIFSRLGTIHQRDGQTDRRTDGQTYTGRQQRPRLRIASRGKNRWLLSRRTADGVGAPPTGQCTGSSYSSNSAAASRWNSGFHCFWHLAAQQPGPQSVDYRILHWCRNESTTRRNQMWQIRGRGWWLWLMKQLTSGEKFDRPTSVRAEWGHFEQLLWQRLSRVSSWLH